MTERVVAERVIRELHAARVRGDFAALCRLFADDGHFEMILSQKEYTNPTGVTQPEINRVVESLRKATPGEVASSAGTGIESTPRIK